MPFKRKQAQNAGDAVFHPIHLSHALTNPPLPAILRSVRYEYNFCCLKAVFCEDMRKSVRNPR